MDTIKKDLKITTSIVIKPTLLSQAKEYAYKWNILHANDNPRPRPMSVSELIEISLLEYMKNHPISAGEKA